MFRVAHAKTLVGRVALLCLGLMTLAACQPSAQTFQSTDVTGAGFAQDFALADGTGRIHRLADYRGKVVMVFFGFTQCPDVCPTALLRAVEVKSLLGAQASDLKVVFITIDPERDRGATLANYTAAFDADFVGLRGSTDETRATAEAFRVYFRKVPTGDSYTMDHSTSAYLYDPNGHLRLVAAHAQTAESIAADVRTLLSQP